jgi:hypothetical protein
VIPGIELESRKREGRREMSGREEKNQRGRENCGVVSCQS